MIYHITLRFREDSFIIVPSFKIDVEINEENEERGFCNAVSDEMNPCIYITEKNKKDLTYYLQSRHTRAQNVFFWESGEKVDDFPILTDVTLFVYIKHPVETLNYNYEPYYQYINDTKTEDFPLTFYWITIEEEDMYSDTENREKGTNDLCIWGVMRERGEIKNYRFSYNDVNIYKMWKWQRWGSYGLTNDEVYNALTTVEYKARLDFLT
jgi:hypothetical protein